MPGAACLPSGWCDYSREHERIRREIEGMIRGYVEGGSDEYYMPVIVAPYGSGKTALLRHLEWFSREQLGVPAARIEFSSLVDFIVERYGSIHESQLPRVVEEFVAERLGSREGFFVLLVDEVEESYDVFRGVVEHETSPLRGLAEAVRTRSTRVYPILALGPSSTLKEAVFGPVAWRSRVFTIPLLPRGSIHAELRERLGGVEPRVVELLSNTAWWASKGRVAWARLFIEEAAPRLAEALERGPEAVEAILLGDEALSREILEGVPLFDRRGYRELKRFLPIPGLAPVLAALVGPVPLSLAEKLAGPLVPEPGPVHGFTRMAVKVEELVEAATAWMERVARARDIGQQSVDHAVTVLEHVASALSLGGMLPFDTEYLREMFSIAADLARELYGDDPHAGYLLETLNPDMVAPEPVRMREPVVYLRPQMVGRLYPVASSSPLIGCARRAGPRQVREVVETLTPDELVETLERLKGVLGLDGIEERYGVKVYLAPEPLLAALQDRIACSALRGEKIAVIVASPGEEAAGLPKLLRGLEKLGFIRAVRAGPRLSMFIYSLIYNESLGLPACSLDRLGPSESRSLNVYAELLRSMAIEALPRAGEPEALAKARTVEKVLGSLAASLAARAAGDPRSLEEAGRLVEAHREAGRAAAALARLIPAPEPRLPDVAGAVEQLKRLVEEVEEAGLLGAAPRCGGGTGSPVLDALLGLGGADAVPSAGRVVSELRAAMEAARSVAVGPAARAAEQLERLASLLEGDAAAAAAALE
ncbi:MAG: hypothetical protein GXO15_00345, partial [Crenarchaeota archaeon]|nr:hypothetical protein [Thermoproteota archaeon]